MKQMIREDDRKRKHKTCKPPAAKTEKEKEPRPGKKAEQDCWNRTHRLAKDVWFSRLNYMNVIHTVHYVLLDCRRMQLHLQFLQILLQRQIIAIDEKETKCLPYLMMPALETRSRSLIHNHDLYVSVYACDMSRWIFQTARQSLQVISFAGSQRKADQDSSVASCLEVLRPHNFILLYCFTCKYPWRNNPLSQS